MQLELESCEIEVTPSDFANLHAAAAAGVRWASLGGPVLSQFSALLVGGGPSRSRTPQ